jgi:hypothetical protein
MVFNFPQFFFFLDIVLLLPLTFYGETFNNMKVMGCFHIRIENQCKDYVFLTFYQE